MNAAPIAAMSQLVGSGTGLSMNPLILVPPPPDVVVPKTSSVDVEELTRSRVRCVLRSVG